MYKHILIPTDGSELAGKAVQHGVTFAKEIGAKITVLTVSAPFHVFTLDPQVVEDTPDQYKKRIQEHTAKDIQCCCQHGKGGGNCMRDRPGRARTSLPSHH